jgi:hypothetical protein
MPRFWSAVWVGLALVAGSTARLALAQEKGDAWKGTTLDPKWHVTVMGDAQTETNGIVVDNGTIRITAGGTDIWNDNDNGLFLWQPANGDFQAVIEVRTLKMISDSTKVGIMVRPSLDNHSAHIYMIAMPKGTHLQARTAVGESAGPSSGDAGRLSWGDGTGSGPTMLMRLTRTGNTFKSERSFDGGVTWERLHDADHPDTDTIEVQMPDDVVMGIAVSAINADVGTTDSTEAVLGPFQFTELAPRVSLNGLLAATAVDANGKPVADTYLVVRKGNDVVGTTLTDPGPSNTGSFFLAPGTYTVTAAGDTFSDGKPVPVEIVTGQVVDIKATVGAPK